MYPLALIYAGAHVALGFIFVVGALFFVLTARRRPSDGEYLFLALNSAVLAFYVSIVAWIHWHLGVGEPVALNALFDVTAASAMIAAPCLLHFVVRYTGSLDERRVMTIAWGATIAFLLVLLGDVYWVARPKPVFVSVLGFETPVLTGRFAWGAYAFMGATTVLLGVCFRRLWRAYRAGRKECLAVMGALGVVALAGANDGALSAGLITTSPVLGPAFAVLTYVMGHTVLQRYAGLARELQRRGGQLERRSIELAASLGELERTQADLVHSEQLAVLGEFAAVITHEVRNPMQIVNNAVSTLRKIPQVTDHTRSLLGIIDEEMHRLERLVGHLLNYARPIVPQRREISLEELLRETIRLTYDDPDEDFVIVLHVKGTWPTITLDVDLMAQAIQALVLNAVQASDGRGRLDVRVARKSVGGRPCVVIGFEDDGEGMTETQVEQATSPFYTTRGTGTGLGLPICVRIVEAHGGTLHIASEPGAGTAVSMLLPFEEDVILPSLDDLG